MHNCLSIPFDDLLANGFNTRQTDVRPAGSVNTAMQLVAVIFQLQSLQQFGGVSATHLDWTMVPYVRKSFYKHFKDGMIYVEGYKYNADLENGMKNYNKEFNIYDEEYQKFQKEYTVFASTGVKLAYWKNYDLTNREQLVLDMANALLHSGQDFIDYNK